MKITNTPYQINSMMSYSNVKSDISAANKQDSFTPSFEGKPQPRKALATALKYLDEIQSRLKKSFQVVKEGASDGSHDGPGVG